MTYDDMVREIREAAGHLLTDEQLGLILAAVREYAAHEINAWARSPRSQQPARKAVA